MTQDVKNMKNCPARQSLGAVWLCSANASNDAFRFFVYFYFWFYLKEIVP
jgi:hypothetical protein